MNGFLLTALICFGIAAAIMFAIIILEYDLRDKKCKCLVALMLLCVVLFFVFMIIGSIMESKPDIEYKHLLEEREDLELRFEHFYVDHPEYKEHGQVWINE